MKKTTGKIKTSKSFGVFIQHQINKFFKEEDLEKGFLTVNNPSIGGEIWFRRPPKEKKVVGVFKKRDFFIIKDQHILEILPDLFYYVM